MFRAPGHGLASRNTYFWLVGLTIPIRPQTIPSTALLPSQSPISTDLYCQHILVHILFQLQSFATTYPQLHPATLSQYPRAEAEMFGKKTIPGVSKGFCLEVLKYFRSSKKHPFVTPWFSRRQLPKATCLARAFEVRLASVEKLRQSVSGKFFRVKSTYNAQCRSIICIYIYVHVIYIYIHMHIYIYILYIQKICDYY